MGCGVIALCLLGRGHFEIVYRLGFLAAERAEHWQGCQIDSVFCVSTSCVEVLWFRRAWYVDRAVGAALLLFSALAAMTAVRMFG